jgi:hypothetical protein
MPKINKNTLNLIAFISLALLTSCGPYFSKEREKILRQNGDKIKVGMTRAEVKHLLGKPDFYYPKLDPTGLLYFDKDMEKAKQWEYIDPKDSDFTKALHFDLKTNKIKKITKENAGV